MIPTAIPNITGREADYLLECVRSGFVSSVGPFVNRLEEMTAEATGATACAATSSGTTGLHAALTAVGVSQGDLVLAPSFSFIASANAIAHCGAMPWFVDIAPDSWCMCANGLEAALREECTLRDGRVIHSTSGRRVAAIMPVYVLGNVAATWTGADDHWSVGAWVKNIGNEFIITNNIITAPLYGSIRVGSVAPPRTYGVTVGYKF